MRQRSLSELVQRLVALSQDAVALVEGRAQKKEDKNFSYRAVMPGAVVPYVLTIYTTIV